MKALAWGVLIIILLLCVQMGAVILYIIGMAINFMQNNDTGLIEYLSDSSLLMEPSVLLGISVVSNLFNVIIFGLWYYFAWVRGKDSSSTIGFSLKKMMLCIAGIAIALQLQTQGTLGIVFSLWPDVMEGYMELMGTLNIKDSVFTMFYVALIAPIVEELIFRGVIFRIIRKRTDFISTNVIQSLLFAIYHINVIQGIYTFIAGMFLGLLMEKGKSILYPILLHILFNTINVIMVVGLPEDYTISIPILLFFAVASIPVLVLASKGFISATNTDEEEVFALEDKP
jgi:membrane protease YdiL (CAAX protease family)